MFNDKKVKIDKLVLHFTSTKTTASTVETKKYVYIKRKKNKQLLELVCLIYIQHLVELFALFALYRNEAQWLIYKSHVAKLKANDKCMLIKS